MCTQCSRDRSYAFHFQVKISEIIVFNQRKIRVELMNPEGDVANRCAYLVNELTSLEIDTVGTQTVIEIVDREC